LIFYTKSVLNISHSRKPERDIMKNVNLSLCNVPVIIVMYLLLL